MVFGGLLIEVAGERLTIAPGEFCCFRKGTAHAIVDGATPHQLSDGSIYLDVPALVGSYECVDGQTQSQDR